MSIAGALCGLLPTPRTRLHETDHGRRQRTEDPLPATQTTVAVHGVTVERERMASTAVGTYALIINGDDGAQAVAPE